MITNRSNHMPMFTKIDTTTMTGMFVRSVFDHDPGRVHYDGGRIHYGHGFSGTGVGPTWLGGQVLAALAQGHLDDPAARLPMVGHRARRFPPEPFRFIGARVIRESIVAKEQRDDEAGYVPPPLRWLVRLPRWMGYDLGPE